MYIENCKTISLKFRQKKNTKNIAAKFCTACSNTLMHKREICQKFVDLTRNDPKAVLFLRTIEQRFQCGSGNEAAQINKL